MAIEKFDIVNLTNNDGCFDLQFRKDVRRERTNSPTYYRWKVQFVVTSPKENVKVLEKIAKEFDCGKVTISKDQARFSVQKIDDIVEIVMPFFRKNLLADKKKKDFDLWSKGVNIIHNNKGKALISWKKSDLMQLIEIQKAGVKYKNKPRQPKWLEMAQAFTKSV
jgi:hypothetical protein